ncbi:hypothetical protein THOM_1264 [Trachipleistophora hominis]|uniref:Uncharacterized protein n=1 Tax=Trachipleistophora hominis TaxID=72359 RepID=L7JWF7_TRAHO|nr:hypothetical protein THOM_1264 [Trachipleistophora hominis]
MQLFLLVVRMLATQEEDKEEDSDFFKPCDKMCCRSGINESGNTI